MLKLWCNDIFYVMHLCRETVRNVSSFVFFPDQIVQFPVVLPSLVLCALCTESLHCGKCRNQCFEAHIRDRKSVSRLQMLRFFVGMSLAKPGSWKCSTEVIEYYFNLQSDLPGAADHAQSDRAANEGSAADRPAFRRAFSRGRLLR